VDEFLNQVCAYVITVCDQANDNCPIFPGGVSRRHWSFEDPAAAEGDEETLLDLFRRVRDRIRERLKSFIEEPAANS
jgi:arsenate reductase